MVRSIRLLAVHRFGRQRPATLKHVAERAGARGASAAKGVRRRGRLYADGPIDLLGSVANNMFKWLSKFIVKRKRV